MTNFISPWWCKGAHAQTICGTLLRKKPLLKLFRERIETPDGDFLDLDFVSPLISNQKPFLVVLHGLEGSSQSPYVQSLLREVIRNGWNAVAVNMRMCSGEANRKKQTYHAGKSEDLDCVLNWLREKKDVQTMSLVGYSLGGNILLKWLGEQGDDASEWIKSAVAISVPYNLSKSVEYMDRGFNQKVYTRILLNRLKKKVIAKQKIFPDLTIPKDPIIFQTFTVFDDVVTAPLNGFKSASEYWNQSSASQFLNAIQVPTHLIHAVDDPFFPGELLPKEEIAQSSYLTLSLESQGGHLGFYGEAWLEKRILSHLLP